MRGYVFILPNSKCMVYTSVSGKQALLSWCQVAWGEWKTHSVIGCLNLIHQSIHGTDIYLQPIWYTCSSDKDVRFQFFISSFYSSYSHVLPRKNTFLQIEAKFLSCPEKRVKRFISTLSVYIRHLIDIYRFDLNIMCKLTLFLLRSHLSYKIHIL